jgi:hypothetical protein
MGKRCFSLPKRPDRLWGPPSLLLISTAVFFRGVRQLGREVDYSTTSGAKVKNAWSYISTPPTSLNGMKRGEFLSLLSHSAELFSDGEPDLGQNWIGIDNDVIEVQSGHLPVLRKTTKHFSPNCLCLSEIRTAACGRQAKKLQPMSTNRHRKRMDNAEKHDVSNQQHGVKSFLSPASHEISRISCNPKAHYTFTRAPTPSPILIQINPVDVPSLPSYFLNIRPPRSIKRSLSLRFLHQSVSHPPAISCYLYHPNIVW